MLRRLDQPELLDEHDAPAEDVDRSLRDLRRINRWFGGVAIYRQLLDRLWSGGLQPADTLGGLKAAAPRSILDLGAGSGDALEALGNGFRIAFDFKIDHLRHARVHRVVGDAMHLPFRDGAVDAVTSAHFFHHFTPEENARILAESLRVARIGVALNDTRRSIFPLLIVQLLSLLRLVGRITRFDAPASVRRAYTPDEAREIAGPQAEVMRLWPFRFGILLWKR